MRQTSGIFFNRTAIIAALLCLCACGNSDSSTDSNNINAPLFGDRAIDEARIHWDMPDERENGEPLELHEIGGYEIAVFHQDSHRSQALIIPDPYTTEITLDLGATGTYAFQVATYDIDGLFSEYSDPSYKTVR